jgi:hypothetical protein
MHNINECIAVTTLPTVQWIYHRVIDAYLPLLRRLNSCPFVLMDNTDTNTNDISVIVTSFINDGHASKHHKKRTRDKDGRRKPKKQSIIDTPSPHTHQEVIADALSPKKTKSLNSSNPSDDDDDVPSIKHHKRHKREKLHRHRRSRRRKHASASHDNGEEEDHGDDGGDGSKDINTLFHSLMNGERNRQPFVQLYEWLSS